jgi:hypothetical protein
MNKQEEKWLEKVSEELARIDIKDIKRKVLSQQVTYTYHGISIDVKEQIFEEDIEASIRRTRNKMKQIALKFEQIIAKIDEAKVKEIDPDDIDKTWPVHEVRYTYKGMTYILREEYLANEHGYPEAHSPEHPNTVKYGDTEFSYDYRLQKAAQRFASVLANKKEYEENH